MAGRRDDALPLREEHQLYEVPWKPLGARLVTGVSLPVLYVNTTKATVKVSGTKRSLTAQVREDAFGFTDMAITPVILGGATGIGAINR